MVLFIHTLVLSKNEKIAQAPGQTYIVTEGGPEPLSKLSMQLVANA